MTPPVVLASASPRRALLLEQLGLEFDVVPAAIDEAVMAGETAPDHVLRLARTKARAIADRRPGSLVLAGDTVVTLGGDILGKPADADEAIRMLLRLEGREHRVETGVAVVSPDGASASAVVGADVRFRRFDRALAEAYVATGEPLDKAGAYGIQGLGAVLVEGIRGDYAAIVGLPVARVVTLLDEVGYAYDFAGRIVEAGGTRERRAG